MTRLRPPDRARLKERLVRGLGQRRQTWATIASLIEACKLNDVHPLSYLADVLTKIVNGHQNSEIEQLLPWTYRSQDLRAVA